MKTLLLFLAIPLIAADPDGFSMWTSADIKARVNSTKLDEHKAGADRVANWGNHSLMVIRREGRRRSGSARHSGRRDLHYLRRRDFNCRRHDGRSAHHNARGITRKFDQRRRAQENVSGRRLPYPGQASASNVSAEAPNIRSGQGRDEIISQLSEDPLAGARGSESAHCVKAAYGAATARKRILLGGFQQALSLYSGQLWGKLA